MYNFCPLYSEPSNFIKLILLAVNACYVADQNNCVVFSGHKNGVNCLAFSNDGLTLASGGKVSFRSFMFAFRPGCFSRIFTLSVLLLIYLCISLSLMTASKKI